MEAEWGRAARRPGRCAAPAAAQKPATQQVETKVTIRAAPTSSDESGASLFAVATGSRGEREPQAVGRAPDP